MGGRRERGSRLSIGRQCTGGRGRVLTLRHVPTRPLLGNAGTNRQALPDSRQMAAVRLFR